MALDQNQIIAIINEVNKLITYNFFADIATVSIIVISILLSVEIIAFLIKRAFKNNRKFPKEVVSGLLNIMRVIAIFIMLFSVLITFGIMDYQTLLSFTTIFSTAMGLASAIAIGNFIAGIYVISSRPYNVGDYITVAGTEGFVKEIGMNYTTLKDAVGNIHKIPNKVSMTANLINYRIHYKEQLFEQIDTKKEKIKKSLLKLVKKKKLTRYYFNMEIELDQNPQVILKKLDEVFQRWTSQFGYKPEYRFDWISWRLNLRVLITTGDMEKAIDILPDFLDDIWLTMYGEREVRA